MSKLKKRILLLVITLSIAVSGAVVYADTMQHFHYGIFLNSKAYEAGRSVKHSGSSYGRVQITWSNWMNLATNFIMVLPGSGIPVSENRVIQHSNSQIYPIVYDSAYVYTNDFTVVLFSNSAQSQANYTIGGNWSPNP